METLWHVDVDHSLYMRSPLLSSNYDGSRSVQTRTVAGMLGTGFHGR